jgi:hypothetical protein
MFGSAIIEVAIGIIFLYMLLSLVCSSLNELLSQVFKLRAKNLEKGIQQILTDKSIRDKFYNHPLVKSLGKKPLGNEQVKPSYIPSRTFALAVLDTVVSAKERTNINTVADLREKVVEKIEQEEGEIYKALLALIDGAKADLEHVQKNVEDWFDDAMDRVSGWYKRQAQWIMLAVSFALACALNVDTVSLAVNLWQNPELRQKITTAADRYMANAENKVVPEKPEDLQKALNQLQEQVAKVQQIPIPIGWSEKTMPKGSQWITKLIGIVLTALAVSLGAPFWFDLLNKISRLRVSGQVPKKASEKT